MELRILTDEPDLVHVGCTGEITMFPVSPDNDALEKLLGPEATKRRVLLNLEQASFIDSSGVSWLVLLHKKFTQGGGKIVLHSVPPMILDVLKLVRLTSYLHIAADLPAGRALATQEAK